MTLPPETIKTMLESEVSACKSVLAEGLNKCKTPLRLELPQFVERSYMLHRRLVERWQGWRFKGEPFLIEDTTFSEQVAAKEWESFVREAGNLSRDGKIPQYAARVICQLAADSGHTLCSLNLLSRKILAAQYLIRTGINGQEFATLSKAKAYGLIVGVTRAGSPHYDQHIIASIQVGQRVSAAVMRGLEEKAPPPLIAAWEKLFQRLGESAWAGQKVAIQAGFSCAPSSFLRLGQYGENSCYRHGGEGEYSKFWLAGDCPDSFVSLFYRLKEGQEPKETAVAGRAWGIACPRRGALVSNFYQLPREMVIPALEAAVGTALDVPNVGSQVQEVSTSTGYAEPWGDLLMKSGAVYLNKDVLLLHNCKSVSKQRGLQRYLAAVLSTAGSYGFWVNKGHGPGMLQLSRTAFRVAVRARSKVPYGTLLWPYKDFPLLRVLQDAVTEQGLFIPDFSANF